MLRRLFGLACACAACSSVRAGPCAGLERVRLTGPSLGRALLDFDELAHAAASLALGERIAFVNGVINQRVNPADDLEQFGADLWLTPLETLALGRGDCEDIAIAKFFVLLAANSPPAALRLLYAIHRPPQTPGRQQAHLIALARQPFVDPLALDSINPLAIPLSWRDDLQPVLSFDCHRLWSGVDGSDRGDATARLRPWRELLLRIDAQPHWRSAQAQRPG
jgi:predicted transglutaminase-like cysteine proteinase